MRTVSKFGFREAVIRRLVALCWLLALMVAGTTASADDPVVAIGDPVVHLIEAPGDHRADVHQAGWIDGELFLIGTVRDKGDDGKQEEQTRLFVMSVGDDGQPRWMHRFDAKADPSMGMGALNIATYDHYLKGRPDLLGVIFINGDETLRQIRRSDGRPDNLREIGRIEKTEGGWVKDSNTTYLVGGGTYGGGHDAWVARINRQEEVVWKTPIRFKGLPTEMSDDSETIEQKLYHTTAATDVIESPDGTLLVVGAHRIQVGKFGGGASDRFVTRFSTDGRELSRAVIPRRFAMAKPSLAQVDGLIYMVHTTRSIPAGFKKGHEIMLTCLDRDLQVKWERKVTDTTQASFGEAVILPTGLDDAPLLIATTMQNAVRLMWCDADGAVVSQSEPKCAIGTARPVRGLVADDEAIVVVNGREEQTAVVRVPLAGGREQP